MTRQQFDTVDVLRLEIWAGADWLDVLGPSHTISISREKLDVGMLTATILDATLDPAKSDLIRPGRPIRLTTFDGMIWAPLFTGHVSNATVTYSPLHKDAAKRSRIALTASDAVASLANVARAEGVAVLDDLRYLLADSGVPFSVNGNSTPKASATIVARNENASLLDQISITRDSVLGYAWVDRAGTLVAYDAEEIPADPVALLDESTYSDLDIGFNTDQVINEVRVKFLRINLANNETVEVAYGPYIDADSVATWGAHAAEFTISGETEDETEIEAYAAKILAANATPRVRINSISLPVRTTDDIASRALIDLYDAVTVSNDNADLAEISRATGIAHEISPTGWTTRLTFDVMGAVAAPYRTPAPPASKSSITVGPAVDEVFIRVSAVETTAETLTTDVSALDTAQTQLQGDLTALDTAQTVLVADLAGLTDQQTTLAADLAALDTQQADLLEALEGLTGDQTALLASLADLDTQQAALEAQLAALDSAQNALLAQLAALDSQQEDLTGDLAGLASQQADLLVSLGNLDSQQTALETALATMETGQADLTNELADLAAEQANLLASLGNLEASQTTLTADLAGLDAAQTTLLASLTALSTQQESLETDLAGLASQQTTLSADLAALDLAQAGLQTDLTALDTAQATLQTDLAALDTAHAATAANLAALTTAQAGLLSDLEDLAEGQADLVEAQSDLAGELSTLDSGQTTLRNDLDALGTDLAGIATDLADFGVTQVDITADLAALTTAQAALATGLGTLQTGLSGLATDLGAVTADLADLAATQATLATEQATLATGLAGLETGQAELADDLAALDTTTSTLAGNLSAAEDEIIATNSRLNSGGDVAQAISDAAASPVTDDRLTAGSITVWPFAGQTIPAGEIGFRELAAGAVRAKNLNLAQHTFF